MVCFSFLAVAVVALTAGCASGPRVRRADVKVERTVGWWSHQDELKVEKLEVRVVEANLNLFNSKALVEYELAGTIANSRGWRPYVDRLFVSQRYVGGGAERGRRRGEVETNPVIEGLEDRRRDGGRRAEFEVVPVIRAKQDKSYGGERVAFSIVVQEIVESGGWGQTDYVVRSGDLKRSFQLHQRK